MVHTHSNGSFIYSVDMMLAYINIFKPKDNIVTVSVADYANTLDYKGWGCAKTNTRYSANDVLANPQKYSDDYAQIVNAELKYPIIIHGDHIVDGVHRFARAHMLGKKTMRAYIFDARLMKKFVVGKQGEIDKIKQITIRQYIEMFDKRFPR